MDPERMAELRKYAEDGRSFLDDDAHCVRELLADRDHHAREAEQAWASRNSADATSDRLAAELAGMRTALLEAEANAARHRRAREQLAVEAERLRGKRDHVIGQRDYAAGVIKRLQIHLGRRTAYAQRLKGERDDAQHEVCVGQAAALIHSTPEAAAAFLGWTHLKFGEADADGSR